MQIYFFTAGAESSELNELESRDEKHRAEFA